MSRGWVRWVEFSNRTEIEYTYIFGSVRSSISANVRLSVCSMKSVLELSIFIFLSQVSPRSVSGQSQVSFRSVSGQSQVSLRSLFAYFVRQTEPEILRLVTYLVKSSYLEIHVPVRSIIFLDH